MDLQTPTELPPLTQMAGQIFLLEAEAGRERRQRLEGWIQQAEAEGGNGWLLPCGFEGGGPWAGVADLYRALLPQLELTAGSLLTRHDYELVSILPELRGKLRPRNPSLTDVASTTEQVRLYPADRALRILHGLIDLIAEWKELTSRAPWLLVCEDFDQAGFLAKRFFAELARRRGRSHALALVIVCAPGTGTPLHQAFPPEIRGDALRLLLEGSTPPPVAEAMGREAQELEDRIGGDPSSFEPFLPRLIQAWSHSRTPERAVRWQYEAFSIYTSRGFYMDSILYGEGALSHLESHFPEDEARRWRIVNKLFACHCATGNPQRALEIVEETLARLRSPKLKGLALYVLAMLHARYLPDKDLAKSEELLELALASLQAAGLPAEELHFQVAFNRNGLAFIRHRQGRANEAIQLCREGFESLRDNLREDQHRLHKSVLLYNIAQVYSSLGCFDEAMDHYSAAMELDPNYSEYYNERGNLKLKKGLLNEALGDYQAAIEMSPPFPEVHANLGHCCFRMGRIEEALQAYTTSLDIDPHQPDLRVMRAQCFEATSRLDEALAEYTEALRLRPDQPLVLANRACLLYQSGRAEAALADLDRAVEGAPENADLYQNRAVALKDLGRPAEAARDLETYLHLRPEAEDLADVLETIHSIRGQGPLQTAAPSPA